MPVYDPAGHELLSDQAAALSGPKLEALADLAEDLLRLDGTSFTGQDQSRARRAVVFQVNSLLEQDVRAGFVESEGKGDQSVSYRQRGQLTLDPIAAQLAERLVGRGRQPRTTATEGRFRPRTVV